MSSDKYTESFLEREFIGYGFDMPDPKWPGGAKICVSFLVQFNNGAESNVEDGDPLSCGDFLEIPKYTPMSRRVESSENMYEYGGREGIPRLLTLFNKYKIPVTWNIYTRALEKSPYWLKPILDSGAEISLGGHVYKNQFDTPPAEEESLLNASIDKLQAITGDKTLPRSWLTDRRSNMTVKLYSQAHKERSLPLLYSSDSCSDDLPYWVPSPAKDGGLLMVPFSYDCSDLRFNMRGSGWASPKDYWLHLKDTFDCLYEEGEEGEPKMMTVLLHPHIMGHANRTKYLEEFLKYITAREGVWITTREKIAEHWIKNYPHDPKTAFGQTKVAECGQIKIPKTL